VLIFSRVGKTKVSNSTANSFTTAETILSLNLFFKKNKIIRLSLKQGMGNQGKGMGSFKTGNL